MNKKNAINDNVRPRHKNHIIRRLLARCFVDGGRGATLVSCVARLGIFATS